MTADEASTASADDSPKNTPLTPAEASALIKASSSGSILTILKDPELLESQEKIFAGFRVQPDSLKNPVVKSRLVAETAGNSKLADAIKALDSSKRDEPAPENWKPTPSTSLSPKEEPKERLQRLSLEHDRLRRELREAHAQLRAVRDEAQAAHQTKADLRVEVGQLQRELEIQRSKGERQTQYLNQTMAELEKAYSAHKTTLRQLQESSARAKKSVSPSLPSPIMGADDLIVNVAERLIARQKKEAVAIVIDEMLRQKPDQVSARIAKALVKIAAGERAEALDELKHVFNAQMAAGDLIGATKTLLQSASLTEQPDTKMVTTLYKILSKQPDRIAEIAPLLLVFHGSHTYASLQQLCRSPLREKLFPVVEEAPANAASELFVSEIGEHLTVSSIIDRIDIGDLPTLRRWRAAFSEADNETRKRVEEAINTAAGHDTYSRLLAARFLAGQAIIDASNVARYEMKLMNTKHALLSSILAVRIKLWEHRYYPVAIIGDANLPHLIDDRSQLLRLVKREEIQLVPTGTVADEVIIREAKRSNAIVVTNDYMIDWDKDGDVEKVNFAISMNSGDASLYFT